MKFKFIEFNDRRYARGADAARVEVTYGDGESEWLWMSKRDIAKNMMAFGRCDELTKAHQAYGAPSRRSLAGDQKQDEQAESASPSVLLIRGEK